MNEVIIKGLVVMGGLGLVFSATLAYFGQRLKVESNPLVEKVLDILPGINCGACGFSSCRSFAEAIVAERKPLVCIPGGEDVNRKVSQLLGIQSQEVKRAKAVVRCGATKNEKKTSSFYVGPTSCVFVDITLGGLDCKYGCIGLGDCVDACPAGAISIKEGRVVIDIKKCIGCGRCTKVCPRGLFELIPWQGESKIYFVACNNKEKGGYVKTVCKKGCIGCGICVRVKHSPFYLQNNLSHINYQQISNQEALEEAKNKCPTKCIQELDV